VTPTNAAPEDSKPSVRANGGKGGATALLISAPKIWAIVLVYCSPVMRRTRNGEALFSGSTGPLSLEQPAIASTNARTTAVLIRNLVKYVNKRAPRRVNPAENYITGMPYCL
jgi:hypothetical protein